MEVNMETMVYEKDNNYLSTDDVAALLVRLYSDYRYFNTENEDYAKAVAIAIRMLTD
jgi:hypothetical protein